MKSGRASILARFVTRFEHRSRHKVTVVAAETPDLSQRDHRPAARQAWLRLVDQFPPVCVGLVAEGDAGIAAAAQMLTDPTVFQQPGASVLLGFSRALVESCLASSFGSKQASGAGTPVLMVLPPGDPHLGACAAACRALQNAGAEVSLAVMPDERPGSVEDAASDLMVGEIDRFFDHHLAPGFPWRL